MDQHSTEVELSRSVNSLLVVVELYRSVQLILLLSCIKGLPVPLLRF